MTIMGRPARILQHQFPYSITTRCNNKEFHLRKKDAYAIFASIFDRLKKKTKSKEDPTPKYVFEVHHLTVMSNHYHLVVSVSAETPIHRFMQLVNSLVARMLNQRLGRQGHLWEDRFKSRILHSLDYLKRTIAYVYHNPLKAGMTSEILDYARSTLRFYWRRTLPSWLSPDPFLNEIPPEGWKTVLEELVLNSFDPAFNLAA